MKCIPSAVTSLLSYLSEVVVTTGPGTGENYMTIEKKFRAFRVDRSQEVWSIELFEREREMKKGAEKGRRIKRRGSSNDRHTA